MMAERGSEEQESTSHKGSREGRGETQQLCLLHHNHNVIDPFSSSLLHAQGSLLLITKSLQSLSLLVYLFERP